MRRNRSERGRRVLCLGAVVPFVGLAAGAAVFAVTSAAAPESGALHAESSKGDARTMVVNIAQAPSTLDPAQGCLSFEVGFIGNFYARLTQYGSKPGPSGTTQVDPGHMKPW